MQRQLNDQRERRTSLEVRISELQLQTQHIRTRLQEEHHCDVADMGPLDETIDEEAVQTAHRPNCVNPYTAWARYT